jgi:2-hydroxychromene-2-carboxylate isomerase
VARAAFYFDLGSPYAYLTAARIDSVMPAPLDWQPVSLGALFKLTGRSSWSLGDQERRGAGIAEVERRAQAYGLPPLRWPDPWPGSYLTAMRAAVYAQRAGRLRAFVRSAYAAGFQAGHDLSVPANVLAAAADAGLDERDVEQAIAEPEIKLALREATGAAHALGVYGVPTIAIDGELFWGDDQLEHAAAHLGGL